MRKAAAQGPCLLRWELASGEEQGGLTNAGNDLQPRALSPPACAQAAAHHSSRAELQVVTPRFGGTAHCLPPGNALRRRHAAQRAQLISQPTTSIINFPPLALGAARLQAALLGALPCGMLSRTSSASSFFKHPILLGILPAMLLPESQTFHALVNKPISAGKLPEREQSVAESAAAMSSGGDEECNASKCA